MNPSLFGRASVLWLGIISAEIVHGIARRRPFPALTAWDSPIVLQHHRQPFWFRNLRIRRLD